MLQVARLAPKLLSEAAERVGAFLREQFHPDGGVRDRAGNPDLYYAVFALEGLLALQLPFPAVPTAAWLKSFGDGDTLDLVHLCCLARCRAALPKGALDPVPRLADRIRAFQAADGGYAADPGEKRGTLYHSFLVSGALEDLGAEPPGRDALLRVIASLELPDGSYSNEAGIPAGATPTTAAAMTLLHHLGAPVPARASEWLLARAFPKGGFAATLGAPFPDLLSTATALHALSAVHVPLAPLKEAALDFIDTLWTGRAFCGTWMDEAQDAEYTYYALLSLGHLSLA